MVTDQGAQSGVRPSLSSPPPHEALEQCELRGDSQAKGAQDHLGPGTGPNELAGPGRSCSPTLSLQGQGHGWPKASLPDSAPVLAQGVPEWAKPVPRDRPRAEGSLQLS